MTIPSRKQFDQQSAAETIKKAAAHWPSIIPRTQVPKLTGGLIAVGTLANLDSAGKGIPGAFRIGRKVCYPVSSVLEFLVGRLEV